MRKSFQRGRSRGKVFVMSTSCFLRPALIASFAFLFEAYSRRAKISLQFSQTFELKYVFSPHLGHFLNSFSLDNFTPFFYLHKMDLWEVI